MKSAFSQRDLKIIEANNAEVRKRFDVPDSEAMKKEKAFKEFGFLCPSCWEPVRFVKRESGPYFRHYPFEGCQCHLRDQNDNSSSPGDSSESVQKRKILAKKIKDAYLTFNGLCSKQDFKEETSWGELERQVLNLFEDKLQGIINTGGIGTFFAEKQEILKGVQNRLNNANNELCYFWELTHDETQKVIAVASTIDEVPHVQRVWLTIRFIIYSQGLLASIISHISERIPSKLAEKPLKILLWPDNKNKNKCQFLILLKLINLLEKVFVEWLSERILKRIYLIKWDSVWGKSTAEQDLLAEEYLTVVSEEFLQEVRHTLPLFQGEKFLWEVKGFRKFRKPKKTKQFLQGFNITIECSQNKGVILNLWGPYIKVSSDEKNQVVLETVWDCISSLAIKEGIVSCNIEEEKFEQFRQELLSTASLKLFYGVSTGNNQFWFDKVFYYVIVPNIENKHKHDWYKRYSKASEMYAPLLNFEETKDPVIILWILAFEAYAKQTIISRANKKNQILANEKNQILSKLYHETHQFWILPPEYWKHLNMSPVDINLDDIGKVKRRLALGNESVRTRAVRSAIRYGETGLDIAIASSKDESPQVRRAVLDVLEEKLSHPKVRALLVNNKSIHEFETVIVNDRGEVIKRDRRLAEMFVEDLGAGVELEMVSIPGIVDSPENEEYRLLLEIYKAYGIKKYEVNVPLFFLGKYPVTQQQYEAVMGNNPSKFKGAKRPVERVTWEDAEKFCKQLSKMTKKKCRLPSKTEWEYACRAGTTTPFCFGKTMTTNLANYNGNHTYGSGPKGIYREQTTDVGSFPPNAFGLYDMHGNVREWCQGVWEYGSDDDKDYRLLRGGSWLDNPEECGCAYDFMLKMLLAKYGQSTIGFRVVIEA